MKTYSVLKPILGLGIILTILAGCGGAPAPMTGAATATPTARPSAPISTAQLEQIETLLEKLAAADVFSGAVLVAQDGTPIFKQAYGLADREANLPNQVDTTFNLASLTKMFTSVAIAQLAEQGKLSFDDPIRTHLPDYPNPEVADTVTIHHLLTHTSGLGDHFNTFLTAKDTLRTVADYVAVFADDPPAAPPGERWQYSNAGFIVLGAIIEQVSGRSYFDYVQEHIFQAAGMPNTGFYERDQQVPHRAIGYQGSAHLSENTSLLPVKGGPHAGAYATVDDLLKFANALRTHQLLRPETTEVLLSGKVDIPDAPRVQYAYGFFDLDYQGTRLVGHNGDFAGVNARFDLYLEHGYTVIVLSNYDPPIADQVADWLGDILLPD